MPHRAHLALVERDRQKMQFALAFQVVLMSRRFRARFAERAKSIGQTDARWSALYMLDHEPGGLIQSELAERMGVQGPTLVRLLDTLESQGLVSRHAVPGDRRAKRIQIEQTGRDMLQDVDRVAEKLRDEVFADVSEEDMQTTLKVIAIASGRLKSAHDRE